MKFFFHCLNSRTEINGNWYSRFYLGPFIRSSRLQVRVRLRRSMFNDLRRTSIAAIKVDGAQHEFSRLSGVYENILELLFQFRKRIIYSPFLKVDEIRIVPFLFFGPGTFYIKDIFWPKGIQCRNLNIPLTTISPSKIIRGYLLVQKNIILNKVQKRDKLFQFCESWKIQNKFFKTKYNTYPWISLGYINHFLKRVRFRIEFTKSLRKKQERLILEIVTDRSIVPFKVVQESTILLVEKFVKLSERISSVAIKNKFRGQNFYERFGTKIVYTHPYSFFKTNLINFCEPLSQNLIHLNITSARYKELKTLGLSNVGQALNRFLYEPNIFSPYLKKQMQQAFFQLGIFMN